jgi:hypothetical protein
MGSLRAAGAQLMNAQDQEVRIKDTRRGTSARDRPAPAATKPIAPKVIATNA